jgi:hypothetical protein
MKSSQLKGKRGQNTAEYMLLLLLIGGGSVFAFKMFGKGIINRFASVTSIMTGGAAVTGTELQQNARDSATKEVDFTTFDGD